MSDFTSSQDVASNGCAEAETRTNARAPFGHATEVELNKLVHDAGLKDGFEGNAQSFRIITRLVADYVAGMTERELMRVFRALEGISED